MSADSKGSSRGQSVLFTNDPRVTQAHRDTVSPARTATPL
jgi:hypothetical protein